MSDILQQAIGVHQSGKLEEAERLYRAALKTTPDQPDALALLGVVYTAKGDYAEAVTLIEKAIAIDPQAPLFRFHLGNTRAAMNDAPRAIAAYQDAVKMQPDFAAAWLALCKTALFTGDIHLACDAGRQAATLDAKNAEAWFHYGLALNWAERHEEALTAYQAAHKLAPDAFEILDNLGLTYKLLNQPEKALAAFHELLERAGQSVGDEYMQRAEDSAFGKWHYHLALLELRMGDYRCGFARYRSRFNAIEWRKRQPYNAPLWRGEDLNGKAILVYDEQGFGDCLTMCRYLPLLKRAGAMVYFIVQPPLAPLFEGWSGADKIIVPGEVLPAFDYQASIFDLPIGFGTEKTTVPNQIPYLPLLAPDAMTRLPDGTDLKVGIVWAGSAAARTDPTRAIPLSVLSELLDMKDVRFFSLNRDMRPGDAEILARYSNVTDLSSQLRDFAVSARFINQLDLVITCDTATAHLAGGMGKPVWTLLHIDPDWRWDMEGENTVWYPGMRLFRQRRSGDWPEVIVRVRSALQEMSAKVGTRMSA